MADTSSTERTPSTTTGTATAATALLWNYELKRENKILVGHSLKMQDRLTEAERLTQRVTKCLNDLVVIVASLASAMANTAYGDSYRLEVLRRQLRHALAPLAEYADAIEKNKFLADCIADLEKLNHLHPGSLIESASPSARGAAVTDPTDSLLQARSRASTSPSTNAQDPTMQPPNASLMEISLSTVMKQSGRSLGEYYDAANDFRRQQKRLKLVDEGLFIDAFLQGLDGSLYRRRMIHWMRKEGWGWAWLEHIVMFIILEEQYMARQEFALAHKFEDGSVLFPDGSRQYRYVILPPITEEDLTPSEASQ